MLQESPFYQECFRALQQSPLCRGLSRAILEDMMKMFTRRIWGKGVQFSEKQRSEYFHIILRGRIELARINQKTGRVITLWLIGPGDGYDILTLLDGRRHEVLSIVVDEVETLTAPMDVVRAWIADHPEFNRCFLPYVADRMRHLEDLSTDLALHDTLTRLARMILHHVDQKGIPSVHVHNRYPVRLISDFSHESLACMVGSVRTVVNRHLQQLKKDGTVDFHRGHLAVINLEKLAALAGQYLCTIPHHKKSEDCKE